MRRARLAGQAGQDVELVAVADGDLVVHQGVGVGLDVLRGGEGLRRASAAPPAARLGAEHVPRQQRDGFGELLGQGAAVADERGFAAAIHPAFEPHLAQHHLRVGGEVFVDRRWFRPGSW